ncbi:MAG: NAD(P)-dependent oxidoreductase [Thermodesulfovibrionia bacterium]|nr:NAD(P)-dependent oxidoreductase [Thermodesulfovibrionia bacterium]
MILIFGHTGFIGSTLYRHFQTNGVDVLGVSTRKCDLCSFGQVQKLLTELPNGLQVVFCSVVNRREGNFFSVFKQNVKMAHNLVKAASPKKIKSLIYLSSVDVYGYNPQLPISENTLPCPNTYYGLSKLTCEHLLRFDERLECPMAILRLPGVYGSGHDNGSIVGTFIRSLVDSKPITIYGDGEILRDYVFVEDLTEIVERIIKNPINLLVNVTTGQSSSLLNIISCIAEILGCRPSITHKPAGNDAAGNLEFDNSLLNSLFSNFKMKKFERGIRDYINALGVSNIKTQIIT